MDSVTDGLPQRPSPYGYVPTQYVAYIFVAVSHSVQAVMTRSWWLFPTACFGGAIEVLGWIGRLWSSYSVYESTPFQIQILATIIAPTPLVAANFMILGRIILRLGPSYSRLRPKWYTWTFLGCDILGFVIQMLGGLIVLAATNNNSDPTNGSNIIILGIVFQLCAIILYILCGGEFYLRYLYKKPCRSDPQPVTGSTVSTRGVLTRRLRILTGALIFSTVCLVIRAVYRTIELLEGWGGHTMITEWYFNVFDGAMIVLASVAFNIAHPGYLLAEEPFGEQREDYKMENRLNSDSTQRLT
ncbi:hypothetical protein ONZ45_g1130 [Pleurotus djamor]|nr:hypothetical protein ONZ45_g1130 [Pleurotus djamor]